MSTMYSRSVGMLEQARHALSMVGQDDAYLDIACFDTQQAIEFLLKAILLENGIAYNRSHDIRYLMTLAQQTGFKFEKEESLDMLADTITDWEESSRYGKGIRTSEQTIRRIHNIYNSMNEAFLAIQDKNQR